MPLLNNRTAYTDLRQTLRQRLSRAEIALWLQLKKRRCLGYKFRRQHGIGRYIVDFYCPQLQLAVEVDGSQHFELNALEYDNERDEWLRGFGVMVVRFTAYDCYHHIESIMLALCEVVRRRARTTSPSPTRERVGLGTPPWQEEKMRPPPT